jgi:retinol dehydrogenase-12
MWPSIEQTTADGYDLQFGTNVLGEALPNYVVIVYNRIYCAIGHFYFTKLLLPTLIATAKTSPEGKARIVNTSSMGHLFATNIDFNTLKDGPARRKTPSANLYNQSKFVSLPPRHLD